MKNNLSDLNNHLFAMLEELNDDEMTADDEVLERTIKKSKAVCSVSGQILHVASLQLSALKVADNCGYKNEDMPALLENRDSKNSDGNRKKLLENMQ